MVDFQNLNEEWSRVCSSITSREEVDASQIIAFFSRLRPQAMSEGFLMLTAENDFMKQWIERHYLSLIKNALKELYQVDFTVLIEVDPTMSAPVSQNTTTNSPEKSAAQQNAFPSSGNKVQEKPIPSANSASNNDGSLSQLQRGNPLQDDDPKVLSERKNTPIDQHFKESMQKNTMFGGTINPTAQLTFENFVIGDSNRMAYSMAVDVAENPGRTALNPLFIYGKSGLGKTHLLRAIQNYIDETSPLMTTVYVDSADLLNDFTEASIAHDKEKSSFKNFKTRYQQADILLIDDIQSLQGKRQTLEIVFEVFNKLIGWGKQVVLSADRAPKNIDIDERYQSRFSQGGIVDIQPPSVETKLGIIKSFINQYRINDDKPNLQIPESVQLYIAENSGSNIRELKGAITKVIYHMEFFHQPNPGVEDVRMVLESFFTPALSHTLTVEDIQKEVESFFKISHKDLIGPSRAKEIVQPRQIAIYLCRQMTDLPFNTIAKRFNRDHSTAMHSVDVMEKLIREDRGIQEEVETLKHIIREL